MQELMKAMKLWNPLEQYIEFSRSCEYECYFFSCSTLSVQNIQLSREAYLNATEYVIQLRKKWWSWPNRKQNKSQKSSEDLT